mmetsp:Transcript_24823/g.98544  ORF Transcript_24823/g.98544 Transcript_24823/m.98544 type:complete len:245 (+) Transcript_24823:2356-3090(+)
MERGETRWPVCVWKVDSASSSSSHLDASPALREWSPSASRAERRHTAARRSANKSPSDEAAVTGPPDASEDPTATPSAPDPSSLSWTQRAAAYGISPEARSAASRVTKRSSNSTESRRSGVSSPSSRRCGRGSPESAWFASATRSPAISVARCSRVDMTLDAILDGSRISWYSTYFFSCLRYGLRRRDAAAGCSPHISMPLAAVSAKPSYWPDRALEPYDPPYGVPTRYRTAYSTGSAASIAPR